MFLPIKSHTYFLHFLHLSLWLLFPSMICNLHKKSTNKMRVCLYLGWLPLCLEGGGKAQWSTYNAFGTPPRLIYVSMKSWISNCTSKNDMKNFLGISCLSPLHNEWPLINQQIQHNHGLSTILTSQDAHLDTGESREVVKRTVRRVASLLHPHVAAVQEHSQIGR